MPGKIPDRWEAYKALGKPVAGTRFITFKVPLEKRMTSMLKEEEQFTPANLVEAVKEEGFELGLVIDLTNTTRYYNSKELQSMGLNYAKIRTEGHVVPSKAVRKRFFRVVDRFLEKNSNNDLLVGVHCTHGLNRTGYLVCRYMIDKLDVPPEKAIQAFNEARGYDMERENYLEDLKSGKSESVDSNSADEEEDSIPAKQSNSWYNSHHRVPRQSQYMQNSRHHQNGQCVPRGRPNHYNHPQTWGQDHSQSNLGQFGSYQQSGFWNDDCQHYYDESANSAGNSQEFSYPNNSWDGMNTSYNSQQRAGMEYNGRMFNQGGYRQGHQNQHGYKQFHKFNWHPYRGRGHGRGYLQSNPNSRHGYGNQRSYGYGAESKASSSYGQFGHRHNQDR